MNIRNMLDKASSATFMVHETVACNYLYSKTCGNQLKHVSESVKQGKFCVSGEENRKANCMCVAN